MDYIKINRPKGIKIFPLDTPTKTQSFNSEVAASNVGKLITGSVIFWTTVIIAVIIKLF